jgi:Cft2 family RNA processing exonuclease
MDSGSSRDLLELWAPDARNAVIITGYSVEGTMARVSITFASSLDLYVELSTFHCLTSVISFFLDMAFNF